MLNKRAVIFANGELSHLSKARKLIQKDDYLIAADAGASHLLKMGLIPDKVVGDFDSIPVEDLQTMETAGVGFIRYPQDKNNTDLELAIDFALSEGYRNILVVAALGGRLDMTLSNISLLTRKDLLDIDILLDDGNEEVMFVVEKSILNGKPGDLVSLFPWGGSVQGVITRGLRWTLNDECLHPSTTRSISNEMVESTAEISIHSGLLLCIHRRMS